MPLQNPTAKQQQVLDFVDGYIKEWGSSPTYSEIAAAIGVTNRGTVFNFLRALEVRGLITWTANESRSIQVVR